MGSEKNSRFFWRVWHFRLTLIENDLQHCRIKKNILDPSFSHFLSNWRKCTFFFPVTGEKSGKKDSVAPSDVFTGA